MRLKVHLESSGRVLSAQPGDDLLEVLQANGEPIATSCGGVASCGLCRVTILRGKEALVPIKPQEIVHLGNVAKVIGLRLACQAQLLPIDGADIVVRVPPVDDVEQRKRKKAERMREVRRPAAFTPVHATRPKVEWRPRAAPPSEDAPPTFRAPTPTAGEELRQGENSDPDPREKAPR